MVNINSMIESGAKVTVAIGIDDLRMFMEEVSIKLIPEKTESYLSPKQVCEKIDIDNSTLWRWAKSGYLTPIKVGGKVRYKLSAIEKILQTEKA